MFETLERCALSREHVSSVVLLQAKALRILDGQQQALPELSLAGILWQQQVVEAGVRRGQAIGVPSRPLNDQAQLPKPAHRCPAGKA